MSTSFDDWVKIFGYIFDFSHRREIPDMLRLRRLLSSAIALCKSISVLRHGTAPRQREKSRREIQSHHTIRYTPCIDRCTPAKCARFEEVSGYSTSDDLRDAVCWTRTIDGQYCLQDYDTCPLHIADCRSVKEKLIVMYRQHLEQRVSTNW